MFLLHEINTPDNDDSLKVNQNRTGFEEAEGVDPSKTFSYIKAGKPPKIKRQKGDTYTSLTQEQTALLVAYLKEAEIILKDPALLSNTAAAEAFEILTAYSRHTLRQDLTAPVKNKENLLVMKKCLENLLNLIERELASIKGYK